MPFIQMWFDCGYFSWGIVSFLHHLPGPHLHFDAETDGPLLMLRPTGYVMATMEMLPLQQIDFSRLHMMRDSLSLLVSPSGVYGKLTALIFCVSFPPHQQILWLLFGRS